MKIADFLLARIAEDEAEARMLAAGVDMTSGGPYTVDHPARVLLRCEADRQIVEEHRPVDYSRLGMRSPNACSICGVELGMGDWEWDSDSFPCLTLRLLALPYADHPDYDESWRP